MITITEKRGSIITAPNKDRRTLVLLTNSTMTSSSSNYRDYISMVSTPYDMVVC